MNDLFDDALDAVLAARPWDGPLKSPLKWHGGKGGYQGKLAKWILSLMPPHLCYVEPFAGSLAVLLAKDPTGVGEIVNDLHGDLCCFWATLRDEAVAPLLMERLQKTEFGERVWHEARHYLDGLPPWDGSPHYMRAWALCVLCRQSLAGRLSGFAPLTYNRTRRRMNEQASAWLTATSWLPAVHARLQRVAVLNRDGLEVIRRHDAAKTLFYCDPPYLHETRTATDVYAHEMGEAWHRQLLDLLRSVKGQVLLSGYPSLLYDTMLADWNRHTFELPNCASGAKKKGRETEVVWCNF
jgi:DNA adenine methylase